MRHLLIVSKQITWKLVLACDETADEKSTKERWALKQFWPIVFLDFFGYYAGPMLGVGVVSFVDVHPSKFDGWLARDPQASSRCTFLQTSAAQFKFRVRENPKPT